jgi:hypothetical protein
MKILIAVKSARSADSPTGMVLPQDLLAYLGISEAERPKSPNITVIPVDQLPLPVAQYNTRNKEGAMVPFNPRYQLKSLDANYGIMNKQGIEMYVPAVQAKIDPATGEILELDHDLVWILDGATWIDDKGLPHGTPGKVVVPIFSYQSQWYVGFMLQWRPGIWDLQSKKLGTWVATFPGGFGSLIGDDKAQAAKEAAEEMNIDLTGITCTGYAVANRAKDQTPIQYFKSQFSFRSGEPPKEGHEKTFGQYAISLQKFPLGVDGIIDTAISFALWSLWLSKP